MARLRAPVGGCPWDVEQDFDTIAPYTIEEAYEVAEAIRRGDMSELQDELGDLLFQVVYHSQMASEQDEFAFSDVVTSICDKMVRRHPHVFGDADMRNATEQTNAWETQKAKERAAKDATDINEVAPNRALSGVPVTLPGLTRAVKLTKRAARVGFDWPSLPPVIDKIREELAELEDELAPTEPDERSDARIREELGDFLFAAANLARHLEIDPEDALRAANAKFEARFGQVEDELSRRGKTPQDSELSEMDEIWDQVKNKPQKID